MSLEEISHTNSDDAAGNFLIRQFERQNGEDFLDERQQELTLKKSPNPHNYSWRERGPGRGRIDGPGPLIKYTYQGNK